MFNCTLQTHQLILILLILSIGGFAGYINSLRYYSPKDSEGKKPFQYILSGMGAAILVPLFLNMLSSNLIRHTADYEQNNYFVFAGFCFIAGYFSDKFIDSIGDKLLQELRKTVNTTSDKLEETNQDLQDNKAKVDALIDNESEIDDLTLNSTIDLSALEVTSDHIDDELDSKLKNIVNSFKGDYKFRTINGISKELKYPTTVVEVILKELEKQGATQQFTDKNGYILWSLTKIGQLIA